MSTTSSTSARGVFAATVLAVIVGGLLLVVRESTDIARADPSDTAQVTLIAQPGVSPAIDTRTRQRVRVQILLSDNTLLASLRNRTPELTGRLPGTTAARRAALRTPSRRTIREAQIAAQMDKQRDAALKDLRKHAASGTRQSERLESYLTTIGATVVDSSPIPNSITAILPANKLDGLAARADVLSIIPAPKTSPQSSPIDGSETWHTNGFTGGGSSLDGNGGPDYGVFDQGVRVTHDAFKSRLPGDCATCMGSGPTRIISPAGRTSFGGAQHGNVIAATVASTNLQSQSVGLPLPWPATWQINKGLAYGVDKVYDEYQAKSSWRWLIGIAYQGEAGVSDLPETINYSAGIYEDTTDMNPAWAGIDAMVANTGISWTISGGNCGIATPSYQGCFDGPHRTSTPGNLPNTITVAGMNEMSSIDPLDWEVWANSSSGPTWGGRKKPDLISTVGSGAGGPDDYNDTGYSNPGTGTSYAAPKAAAGTLLLSSVGVYAPTAQKAILINSAHPIDGQTYWHPRSGWGGLNLEDAFYQRANYMNGSVTPAGANGTRFYKQTSVAAGDRTTLVWNRRIGTYNGNNSPPYSAMTNLDLIQIAESDTCSPSCTPTATGGSDAADTVDTNQTVSVDNPMPGSGTDGEDNVEQVRSTGTGDQIFKVKAMGSIDGAASEQFSIAGTNAVEALESPIPTIDLSTDLNLVQPSATVTVTAQVENPSSDLGLSDAEVTLNLPSGVALTNGTQTQAVTLGTGASDSASWEVQGTTDGLKSLSAEITGTAYGEEFEGSDTADVTVDGTPPVASADGPDQWSTTADVPFTWSATDVNGVATYDVEVSRNGGAFQPIALGTTNTAIDVNGTEGELLELRVTATDQVGNVSSPATHSVTVDAIAPQISITSVSAIKGSATVGLAVSNIGAPVTATYFFGIGDGPQVPLIGPSVSFTNTSAVTLTPTLKVTATDATGRSVNATFPILVPSRFVSPKLRITKLKSKRGKLTISGSIAKAFSGKVAIEVKRTTRTGTPLRKVRVKVKRGRFAASVTVAPGKYSVKAVTPRSNDFLAGSATKRTRVR